MCSHNLYWRQSHQLSCCTQCTITYAEHQQHSLPGSVTKFYESDSYAAPPNRVTKSSLVAEILPFIPASYRYPCLTKYFVSISSSTDTAAAAAAARNS